MTGVKDIPDYFLSGCTKLETLEIGNSITKIGNRAFQQTNITSIAIPDSVTVIGEQAFNGCTSLTEVNVPKNSKLETIRESCFSTDKHYRHCNSGQRNSYWETGIQ